MSMRGKENRPFVYMATLGNTPQVVTLALDWLLPHHPFVEVCVIHTDDTAVPGRSDPNTNMVHDTVKRLDKEFQKAKEIPAPAGEQAWRVDYHRADRYYQFTYRRVLIQREEQPPGQLTTMVPVSDIETETNAQAAFRTIFQAVRRYKSQRAIIHLNIAGGRRSMSVFGMAAAQLLFTSGDHIWHLVSKNELEQTRAMHDDGTQTSLVPIPFISLSAINPILGNLVSSNNPYDIVQAQERYLQLIDLQRKEKFLRVLDHDEYQILVGVAQGLSNDEIGKRLKRTLAGKTVANKLTTIYETYIVSISEVPLDVTRPSSENMRAYLAAEFGAYFQQRLEYL